MKHLDLFSGIGGFAYAVDQVWPGSTHVFCDNNVFCQKVLKKHWPGAKIYDDIRTITNEEAGWELLTGGFPCQPFSQAGKRRGTEDDRYLWPEMLRVIQLTKPTWIIGENVRGFVTWNEGLVLEQVRLDLEAEGYEVQPLIIPACAVNAPHRRDRVWIIAHTKSIDGRRELRNLSSKNETQSKPKEQHQNKTRKFENASWDEPWIEVATRLCRVDDGVSNRVDRLRGLGNAIVPQVAIEIMKAIKESHYEQQNNNG
jgi:DNA (cytosine-5)-methyltransferase 1